MNQSKDISKPCPNCGETNTRCACMRNICIECGKPVGNITFSVCDDCWDKAFPPNQAIQPTAKAAASELGVNQKD